MATDNWAAQVLPRYEWTEWSPPAGAEFTGVAVWQPESVSLAATGGRLPLAGVVRLPRAEWERIVPGGENPLLAVVVGAILAGTNTPYVGQAVLQAPLFAPAAAPFVTEYFNVDLRECAGLPRSAGRFFVFASVGPHAAAPRAVAVTA